MLLYQRKAHLKYTLLSNTVLAVLCYLMVIFHSALYFIFCIFSSVLQSCLLIKKKPGEGLFVNVLT